MISGWTDVVIWGFVFRDDFKESEHPRGQPGNAGQFGPGGGSSAKKPGNSTSGKSHPTLTAKTTGSTAERIALKKLMKETPKSDKETHHAIKAKILESYSVKHQKLSAKGDPKAAEVHAKIQKYSAMYGFAPPKTVAQANEGYTKAVVETAKKLQAEVYGTGPMSKEKFEASLSPSQEAELTATFNDLVALSGGSYDADKWTSHAKNVIKSGRGGKLSVGELAHVAAYTGSAYRETNASLRSGKTTEVQWKHVAQLNSALDKMPSYDGEVYRKVVLTPQQFAFYEPGMIVEERAFTSTSKNSNAWTGNYRYVIRSLTGKDVSKISSNGAKEAEVLFRSNTRFKVTKIEGSTIHMEEVRGR